MSKIGEIFSGMRRNIAMVAASLVLIFLTLSVLGFMTIISANTNKMTNSVIQSVRMHVYLKPDLKEEEINSIKSQLAAKPQSKNVTYSTKEEQLKLITADFDPQTADVLNKYFSGSANPLNPVIYIDPKDSNVNMEEFKQEIETIDGVDSADYGSSDGADYLITYMKNIKQISIIIVIVLSVITIFLIINTVKLTIDSRKKEIEIMRLVGATKGYITFPFAFEGVFLGFTGGTAAFLIMDILYTSIYNSTLSHMGVIAPSTITVILLITQILFGVLIGLISSLIAIRNYLKV